jgi:hypothetical protein
MNNYVIKKYLNINLSLEKLPGRKILPTPSFRRLLLKIFHVCFGTQKEIKNARSETTNGPTFGGTASRYKEKT